jgi:uncharacterized membrane protein YkvA (DUF1232 family)
MFAIIRLISFTGLPRLILKLVMDSRVPALTKLILPAAVIYWLSPIDFFPDVFFPFGKLDDLIALGAAPLAFIALSPRAVVLEHMGRTPALEPEPEAIETTARTLDTNPDEGEG